MTKGTKTKQISTRQKFILQDVMRSKISDSPKIEDILDTIQMMEGHSSTPEMYRACRKIDPLIGHYVTFQRYIATIKEQRKRRATRLLRDMQTLSVDGEGENSQAVLKNLVEIVSNKIFTLGNVAITQELEMVRDQISRGELLSDAQREKLIKWFFQGADSLTKSRGVDARMIENEREQSIVDSLLASFQYQKLQRADVIDGEIVKPELIDGPKEDGGTEN